MLVVDLQSVGIRREHIETCIRYPNTPSEYKVCSFREGPKATAVCMSIARF